MKQLRKNIRKVALLLCCLFLLLAGYGAFSLLTSGSRWFSSTYNQFRLRQQQNVAPGDIYDRAGTLLASSEDGKRVYPGDPEAVKSVSHVLASASDGVEKRMSHYLYGFNASYFERLAAAFRGETRKGDAVTLTIDGALCSYIASQFPTGHSGAVAVMNYKTGELLALQSYPGFDPASASVSVKVSTNRAVKWTSAPGSTFKIVTLASALQNIPGVGTRAFTCTGVMPVGIGTITDAGTKLAENIITKHDTLTIQRAFAVSCNNTFAAVALELGDQTLKATADQFGLSDNFLFRDLIVENSSYPLENRSDLEIAWTGAGQSALAVTPLHMCMIASGIANQGVMMEPRLLLSAASAGGTPRASFASRVYRTCVSETIAATLKASMRQVVAHGTGTAAAVPGLVICGKTGSAQIDGQALENAWFTGFIDSQDAPYAVCVVVEDAGGGGSVAAPLAGKIFKYLANH